MPFKPVIIPDFKSLQTRDALTNVPPGHLVRARNIRFREESIKIRPGLSPAIIVPFNESSFAGRLIGTGMLTGSLNPSRTLVGTLEGAGDLTGTLTSVAGAYMYTDDFSDGTCTPHVAPRWGDIDWAVAAVRRIDTKSCSGVMMCTWEADDNASGGKVLDFSTYATFQPVPANLGTAALLSEADWVYRSGDASHSVISGPAVCISGSFNAGTTACYSLQVFSVATDVLYINRVVNSVETGLSGAFGSPIVGDRLGLTAEFLFDRVRLRAYQNGTLIQTYDDTSVSRLSYVHTMGYVAMRVAPNATNLRHEWDNWTCASPTLT